MASPAVESSSDAAIDLEKLASYGLCPEEDGLGGVDGSIDGSGDVETASLHLYNMRISHRLASRGLISSASSPQLSLRCYHRRGLSSVSVTSRYTKNNSPSLEGSKQTTLEVYNSGPPLAIKGYVFRDGTSSFYPSQSNSVQGTPKTSTHSFPSLLTSSLLKLGMHDTLAQGISALLQRCRPSVSCTDLIIDVVAQPDCPVTTSHVQVYAPLKNLSTTSLNIPLIKYPRRPTIDSSSLVSSETDSFNARELELSGIMARFAGTVSPRSINGPVHSKFVEQFDVPGTALQKRPSMLSAIQHTRRDAVGSHSYDGSNSVGLQTPEARRIGFNYAFTSGSPAVRTAGQDTPEQDDEEVDPYDSPSETASALWQRAIKQMDSHATGLADRAKLPANARSDRKEAFADVTMNRSWKRRSTKTHRSSIRPATEGHSDTVNQLVACPEQRELDKGTWLKELATPTQNADQKTPIAPPVPTIHVGPNPVSYAERTQRQPGDLWARFPSHNREERTGTAGNTDAVATRDFASTVSEDGCHLWVKSERKHAVHRHPNEVKDYRSLSSRLGRHIRKSLYRIRTSKSSSLDDTLHGRRSSVRVAGVLEYPELEIMPVEGAGALEALEMEIGEAMRRDERKRRAMTYSDGVADPFDKDGEVDIGSPSFYADCMLHFGDDDDYEADAKSERTAVTTGADVMSDLGSMDDEIVIGAKFKTWSGKDRANLRCRRLNDRSQSLRRSTMDFKDEVEAEEVLARLEVLKTIERVLGEGNAKVHQV